MVAADASEAEVLVLGAGYAGVTVSHAVRRFGRGRVPLTVVDRHPTHTLRTRLYEVDRLAAAGRPTARWSLPIEAVLSHDRAKFVEGEVSGIDLDRRRVRLGEREIRYRALAICLGSEVAYYGVPGAAEHTEQVYRLAGALHLAQRLRALAERSGGAGAAPVRVAVVGGGSTGTEVAAEIATARWSGIVRRRVPRMEVTLVVGAVPFLAGMSPAVVGHARELLAEAGVTMVDGVNVARVAPGRLELADGSAREADVVIWCAGLSAPALVRGLPVDHGRAGRIVVDDRLEVPGYPGVFAVGDVIDLKDPRTGVLVPMTAQAALAEAPVAGHNLVAHLAARPYRSFAYKERGIVVALGRAKGSGSVAGLAVWGRPAGLLKAALDGEYAFATARGRKPPAL